MFLIAAVPASSMPPFAQAYGIKCSVCHTAVPALNAYGRYVQRTGYGSLDRDVIKRALPLWIGENAYYDTQSSNEPHKVQFGNLAIHAVGFITKDITYHAQQWIVQNDQSGGIDTLWVTYNHLLHNDAHLFVGKMPPPGPSPYSQWLDISGFSTPSIVVGEHPYLLASNRWGTKLNYVRGAFDAELGYFAAWAIWAGVLTLQTIRTKPSSGKSLTQVQNVPLKSESTGVEAVFRWLKGAPINTTR